MKNVIIFFALGLCLVVVNAPVTRADKTPDSQLRGAITQGIQIGAHAIKAKLSAEEPVVVDVQLWNRRDKDLHYEETNPCIRQLTVEIRDNSGNEVPLTAFGKRLYDPKAEVFSPYTVTLPPGEHALYHVCLSRVFDLSLPGRYLVTVKKKVYGINGSGVVSVTSNAVQFDVTPPRAPLYELDTYPDLSYKTTPWPVGQFQIHF